MKRILIAAAVFAGLAVAAWAQTASVTLQNDESAPFYYVVDPPDLAGLTTGSPLIASKVAGFFAATATEPAFAVLAPGTDTVIPSLSEGTHLLVGFFAVQDLEEFPVRVISLQADSRIDSRFYAIFASPAQLTVPRGTGRLTAFARTGTETAGAVAPQTSVEAQQVQQPEEEEPGGLRRIATFAPGYDPMVFTRETGTGLTVLPIEDSRAWSTTGTRIGSISGMLDASGLRFSLSVPSGFSEKVSYFLYVFAGRAAGTRNALTLEVEPRATGSRGACILWRSGESEPRLVGDVSTTADTVEVSIDPKELAESIAPAAGESPSVDLTAGWFDHAVGSWEEFYFTTFSMADIPVRR